jgi:hypothetical protein
MDMMRTLHHGRLRQACRLWIYWTPHIKILITRTATPEGFEQDREADEKLFGDWQEMVAHCIRSWEVHVGRTLVAVDEYLPVNIGDNELVGFEMVGYEMELAGMRDDDDDDDDDASVKED